MPVSYARGSERQVHAEFLAYRAAHPDEAADSFALVYQIAAAGLGSLDTDQASELGRVHPLCRQAAGWGLFFEVEGPRRGRCAVTLLLVADLALAPFDRLRRDAAGRWRAAKEGTGP